MDSGDAQLERRRLETDSRAGAELRGTSAELRAWRDEDAAIAREEAAEDEAWKEHVAMYLGCPNPDDEARRAWVPVWREWKRIQRWQARNRRP